MKVLKFIFAIACLALALNQSALATTGQLHIYIAGSSAFRSVALSAIASALGITSGSSPALLSSGGTGNDTSVAGTGNTTFIWEGGSVGDTPVTVCATFTGSGAGIQATTGSIAIPFMNDSNASSNPSTVGSTSNASAYTDIQASTPNSNYGTAVPDFCFSDVYQTTTLFNHTFGGQSYTAGHDTRVAIVTYKWMASTGFPLGSGYTTGTPGNGTTASSYSVTPNFMRELFLDGLLPLSQMTGNTTDQQVEIIATGGNYNSGARATAFADCLLGVNTLPLQYYPAAVSGGSVTDLEEFPATTIGGSSFASGQGGQASDGGLRSYLQLTVPSSLGGNAPYTTAMYFLTYLGTSDAALVEGGAAGAVELLYKGVSFSVNAVYQGQYTLWSYEHVIDIGLTGTKSTFESSVISTIQGYTTGGTLSGVGISMTDPNIVITGGTSNGYPNGTGLIRTDDGKAVKVTYTF